MLGEVIDKCSGLVRIIGEKVIGRLQENIDKGQIRVDRLAREFREKGYFVVEPSRVNKGVDLLIFDIGSGRLVEVSEVTNYAETSYMKDDRVQRYICSLNSYDKLPNVRKIIYCSFKGNVFNKHVKQKTLDKLRKSEINVVAFGYQDLGGDG